MLFERGQPVKKKTDPGLQQGSITAAFDPRIRGIVDNWPQAVNGARAATLGLPSPPPLAEIVRQYLEDFG